MATIDATAVIHDRASDPPDAAVTICPACVHPETAHDVIATRFCAATTARALPRGCACRC
jgi:hypothetical protein